MNIGKNIKLPEYFKPVLWSYNFSKINVKKNRVTIIINTINYGDLRHWRWIAGFYGKSTIANILKNIPATEIRSRVIPLASLLFGVDEWSHAPRGVNR